MIYDIKLQIDYEYDSPAVSGRHLACLLPPERDRDQRMLSGALIISPPPAERLDRQDFFGNRVTEFSFRTPHDAIRLMLRARIDRATAPGLPDGAVALADLPQMLGQCRDLGPDSPWHFLAASLRVPQNADMMAFAAAVVEPGMTVADVVLALGHALFRHMSFDAKATTVDTPASQAFAQRKGVCQDFSHIMIAGLRGLGIPAGYMSGFLRTIPPPGKPRLEGADAMHAWVRAWCGPKIGWIEFDPTNDKLAGSDHILVARGRDYADVAPVKGTLRIAGGQKSEQAVDVVPIET